eukprot:3185996-Rhodomonas_salina.1
MHAVHAMSLTRSLFLDPRSRLSIQRGPAAAPLLRAGLLRCPAPTRPRPLPRALPQLHALLDPRQRSKARVCLARRAGGLGLLPQVSCRSAQNLRSLLWSAGPNSLGFRALCALCRLLAA